MATGIMVKLKSVDIFLHWFQSLVSTLPQWHSYTAWDSSVFPEEYTAVTHKKYAYTTERKIKTYRM